MKLSGPRSPLSTALAMALSILLLAPSLAAQAPPPESGETFFESIEVEVVNVEVFVTRRNGEPVRGLTREDFQLLEDGKPVPITNFYAIADGAQQLAADEDEDAAQPVQVPDAAAPAVAAPETASVPEEQRLHLALYVDDRNLTQAGRNRVLAEVEKFFAGRPKGEDRLLLVSYNGSLTVRQAPTDDPAALAAAMEEVAKGAPRGTHEINETRRLLAEIAQIPGVGESGGNNPANDIAVIDELRSSIKTYAQKRQTEIRGSLGALGQFVGWLSGLPGRKALLYVSGGLSLEPGEALTRVWGAKFGGEEVELEGYLQSYQYETSRLLSLVAERANASRVTFYALGAPEAISGASAEFAGMPEWTSQDLESVELANRTDSLVALAADTGGLAALDAVRAGSVLERMRRDLDSYYSLGFTPSHPRDGKVHRLEVRLRDRSLSVRHREGYRSNSMAELMGSRVLAALALGEASNPLAVALEFGKEQESAKGQVHLPVLVRFALSDLVLVPRDTLYEGRVRLYVAARDDKGRTSRVRQIEIPVRVPREELREALARQAGYVVKLHLRSGKHRVAVTVLDDVGRVASTVTASYPSQVAGKAQGGTR